MHYQVVAGHPESCGCKPAVLCYQPNTAPQASLPKAAGVNPQYFATNLTPRRRLLFPKLRVQTRSTLLPA